MVEKIIEGTDPQSTPSASTANKPAGTTSIDEKLSLEIEILAQKAANKLTADLATRIGESADTQHEDTIILMDDALTAALALHRTFVTQGNVLIQSFRSAQNVADSGTRLLNENSASEDLEIFNITLINKPKQKQTSSTDEHIPLATPKANLPTEFATLPFESGLNAAVDLLGFFNVNTEYYGREASVSERSFAAQLARELKAKNFKVSWPSKSFSLASLPDTNAKATYLQILDSVAVAADHCEHQVQLLHYLVSELQENDSRLHSVTTILDQASQLMDDARLAYDTLIHGFFNQTTHHGMTANELLLMSHQVTTEMGIATNLDSNDGHKDSASWTIRATKDQNLWFLNAGIEKAGGSYRIRQHFWQALTGEPPLSFSAGAILSFLLFDRHGKLCLSGTETENMSYQDHPAGYDDSAPGSYRKRSIFEFALMAVALLIIGLDLLVEWNDINILTTLKMIAGGSLITLLFLKFRQHISGKNRTNNVVNKVILERTNN